MQAQKEVEDQISLTKTVELVATAYEEVSVMRMQTIREKVLNSRNFAYEINRVYNEVKKSYALYSAENKAQSEGLVFNKNTNVAYEYSTLNKNGRTLYVLVMPRETLTGGISQKIFDKFIDKMSRVKADVMVLGPIAKQMIDTYEPKIVEDYKYFDIPIVASTENIKPLIEYMLAYSEIEVFHGKFVNLVKQSVARDNISGGLIPLDNIENISVDKYLFEPSVDKILNFFEIQILESLFKQTLSETELAKLGSRINAMEAAVNRTKDRFLELLGEKRTIDKSIDNRNQIQRFAGISLWRGKR